MCLYTVLGLTFARDPHQCVASGPLLTSAPRSLPIIPYFGEMSTFMPDVGSE